MEFFMFILGLGALVYGIWRIVEERKASRSDSVPKTPPSMPSPPIPSHPILPDKIPIQQPSISDIMKKLDGIERRVRIVEGRAKGVLKRVKGSSDYVWAVIFGSVIGFSWNDIWSFIKEFGAVILGILFWVIVGYVVWQVAKRIVRAIQGRRAPVYETLGPFPNSSQPALEPLNSDVMRKLEKVEECIKSLEVQTIGIDKKVEGFSGYLWPLVFGWMIGFFFNEIWITLVNTIFKSLSVGQ